MGHTDHDACAVIGRRGGARGPDRRTAPPLRGRAPAPETIARLAARHGLTEVRTRLGQLVPGVDPQDPASDPPLLRRRRAGVRRTRRLHALRRCRSACRCRCCARSTISRRRSSTNWSTCAEAGSLHTELRGSPFRYQEHVHAPLEEIAAALVRGVDRAWAERRVSGTFILAFSRQKGLAGADAPAVQRQAAAVAAAGGGAAPPRPARRPRHRGLPGGAVSRRAAFEDALRARARGRRAADRPRRRTGVSARLRGRAARAHRRGGRAARRAAHRPRHVARRLRARRARCCASGASGSSAARSRTSAWDSCRWPRIPCRCSSTRACSRRSPPTTR